MQVILTPALRLEPLEVAHAEEMFALLADPVLHEFTDSAPPPSLEALRERYARLTSRCSADGAEQWLNWIVRGSDGRAIGFVQATVCEPAGTPVHADGPVTAWVAYLVARAHGGLGHGTAATAAMIEHLELAYGVRRFLAQAEAANEPSIRLLQRLGFHAATPEEAARHTLTETERLFVR